jgi:hypothetical protein
MTTGKAVENEYEAERLRRIAENRKRMEVGAGADIQGSQKMVATRTRDSRAVDC